MITYTEPAGQAPKFPILSVDYTTTLTTASYVEDIASPFNLLFTKYFFIFGFFTSILDYSSSWSIQYSINGAVTPGYNTIASVTQPFWTPVNMVNQFNTISNSIVIYANTLGTPGATCFMRMYYCEDLNYPY